MSDNGKLGEIALVQVHRDLLVPCRRGTRGFIFSEGHLTEAVTIRPGDAVYRV